MLRLKSTSKVHNATATKASCCARLWRVPSCQLSACWQCLEPAWSQPAQACLAPHRARPPAFLLLWTFLFHQSDERRLSILSLTPALMVAWNSPKKKLSTPQFSQSTSVDLVLEHHLPPCHQNSLRFSTPSPLSQKSLNRGKGPEDPRISEMERMALSSGSCTYRKRAPQNLHRTPLGAIVSSWHRYSRTTML